MNKVKASILLKLIWLGSRIIFQYLPCLPFMEINMAHSIEKNRVQPHRWRPDEDEPLANEDPLEKIGEEMAARGLTSLWTPRPTPARKGAVIQFDDEGKRIYLRKLATTGRHTYSAAAAGVSRFTVNCHKRKDPIFAAAIEEAIEYFRDLLGGELVRRGVEGFEVEVLGGKNRDQIFKLKTYSDRCLELLGRIHIAAMNTQRLPSTATQTNVDNSNNLTVNNTFDLATMPADELLIFKQLVEKQQARVEKEKLLIEDEADKQAKEKEKVIEHE